MRDPDIFDTIAERAFAGENVRHVRAPQPPLLKCAARAGRKLTRLNKRGARSRAVMRQYARLQRKLDLNFRRARAWKGGAE